MIDNIDKICEVYKLDKTNDLVRKNVETCLSAERLYDLDRNSNLLRQNHIFESKHCPTAMTEMAVLIMLWQTKRTNEELSHITGQVAAPARNLRDRGFLFRTEKKKDGTICDNWIFHENGLQYREILDFNPAKADSDPSYIVLSHEVKTIIKSVFNEDVRGDKYLSRNGEIDHRIPDMVRKRLGIVSVKFTMKTLLDGSWIRDFQIFSKNTNDKKGQICRACFEGGIIRLPPGMEPFAPFYRRYFQEDNEPCSGCYHMDSTKPKNPNALPDFATARKIQDDKVQEVIRKVIAFMKRKK